jgi:hypothetical protein
LEEEFRGGVWRRSLEEEEGDETTNVDLCALQKAAGEPSSIMLTEAGEGLHPHQRPPPRVGTPGLS